MLHFWRSLRPAQPVVIHDEKRQNEVPLSSDPRTLFMDHFRFLVEHLLANFRSKNYFVSDELRAIHASHSEGLGGYGVNLAHGRAYFVN